MNDESERILERNYCGIYVASSRDLPENTEESHGT
jgi:hypothetical protein